MRGPTWVPMSANPALKQLECHRIGQKPIQNPTKKIHVLFISILAMLKEPHILQFAIFELHRHIHRRDIWLESTRAVHVTIARAWLDEVELSQSNVNDTNNVHFTFSK